jgi:hypothetical protein
MQKIVCRASAKVPIVKCWDPELRMACDINVNNPLALENTRMIKTYVQMDERVREVAKVVKYWTKRRILNDAGESPGYKTHAYRLTISAAFGGTISSYTWTCMIISFLQRRVPPILPSLQKIEGKRLKPDSAFADDLEALKGFGDANKESSAHLLFHFFRHYGYEFNYHEHLVSVREGRLVTRKEKGWDYENHWDKEAQKRLCVEEPFTINRNLGNSADEYSWSGVHSEIRRAFDLLADGQQLDKACEQYEFPPEEKREREPMFQKPAPRPAPTLRRSASQSGRSGHEGGGSGRSRKNNNRNQSSQRLGNRRASSGASFSNQRGGPLGGFTSPPPLGGPGYGVDYLSAKGNLHDQLFQQYQFLRAQENALQSQLVLHAAQQAQGQRIGDLTGSPAHRNSYASGAPSPRYLDPPQTAPLLPGSAGFLYSFPSRYPPASPMPSARTREGTNTNPSSPSMVAAVPALRRQAHRASVTDGSSGSIRSQSQPGRSLQYPLPAQHQPPPGYDIAQFQNVRQAQLYAQAQAAGMQGMFSPLGPSTGPPIDSAMPKEYMGYLVGQSPQFRPQQFATATANMPPPMTLRDPPPQRPRRVTPDLMPPIPNGRHASRSPSPLGHLRSYSTTADLRSKAHADFLQSPSSYEPPVIEQTEPAPAQVDLPGPLIVNGSNPSAVSQPFEEPAPLPGPVYAETVNGLYDAQQPYPRPLPLRTSDLETQSGIERSEPADRQPSSPRISPGSKPKTGHKLALSPNGTSQTANGFPETFHEPPAAHNNGHHAPLLSPVAELRTPSPTQAHAFEKQESPQNGLMKAAKIANARQFERNENGHPGSAASVHERKGSAPNPTLNTRPGKSPTLPAGPATPGGLTVKSNQNEWQQATKKGHKKSKSTAGPRSHTMPANEAERKGG